MIIEIILLIILALLTWYLKKNYFHYKKANKEIDEYNNNLEKINKTLKEEQRILQERNDSLYAQTTKLIDSAHEAYEKYCDTLETAYHETECEYDDYKNILKRNYEQFQAQIDKDIKQAKSDLVEIQITRSAAITAQIREKEIKEKQEFYCLKLTEDELSDIHVLERVKIKLHQPRILCMLIWSTFYQKPMTTLCNNILGAKEVCGIYKITNQTNGMCYIGQSVDVAKRWKDHVKCGLGIDTPVKNKLYRAMQEDGLENFSWELLEECNKEFLNEKEKFYIDLYQSNDFGYNSNKGVG